MLLKRGASVTEHSAMGWTALHEAALWGKVKVMETLLKAKDADIDERCTDGDTPLHFAVW